MAISDIVVFRTLRASPLRVDFSLTKMASMGGEILRVKIARKMKAANPPPCFREHFFRTRKCAWSPRLPISVSSPEVAASQRVCAVHFQKPHSGRTSRIRDEENAVFSKLPLRQAIFAGVSERVVFSTAGPAPVHPCWPPRQWFRTTRSCASPGFCAGKVKKTLRVALRVENLRAGDAQRKMCH